MMQPWFDATATASPYAKAFSDTNDSDVEVIELPSAVNKARSADLTVRMQWGSGFTVTDVNASVWAKQYGRNDLVTIVSPQGEEKEMKYKKIDEYLAKGWMVKG